MHLFPIYLRDTRSTTKIRAGYINANGVVVVQPKFEDGLPFSEDLASVALNGRWGYIDVFGEFVIPPSFDDGDFFSEGKLRH
jgi:hypothetical protein